MTSSVPRVHQEYVNYSSVLDDSELLRTQHQKNAGDTHADHVQHPSYGRTTTHHCFPLVIVLPVTFIKGRLALPLVCKWMVQFLH